MSIILVVAWVNYSIKSFINCFQSHLAFFYDANGKCSTLFCRKIL